MCIGMLAKCGMAMHIFCSSDPLIGNFERVSAYTEMNVAT